VRRARSNEHTDHPRENGIPWTIHPKNRTTRRPVLSRFSSHSHTAPRRWFVALAVAGALGCDSSAQDAIERDVFIATYVDLRIAASETDSLRIGDVERTEVLARHGVTGDELTHFADVYADDLEFMREVWNEVEVQLDHEPEAN